MHIPSPAHLRASHNLYCICIFLLLCISSCASIVRPNYQTEIAKLRSGQFNLDAKHSFLLFKVEHLGLSTYVGRFNKLNATMDFDPANLPATRLDGIVDMASIDTNDADLEELLQKPQWFDTAQFPQATFTTTEVQVRGNNKIVFKGDLTLRGVTKPITMLGVFNGGADNLFTGQYTIGFSASGSISRAAFGMDQFGALVGDEIKLEVFAEFLKNQV